MAGQLYIFIDRARMQVASTSNSIMAWDFPPKAVRDMQILNAPLFLSECERFFAREHLQATTVTMVLGETTYFMQKITPKDLEQNDQMAREFYDMIPCENIMRKEYPQGKETLLVAADKDFIEMITGSLARMGCVIESIIPSVLLGEVGAKRWLDAPYVAYLAQNLDVLTQWSFDVPTKLADEPQGKPVLTLSNGKAPYGLLIVFMILVVVLMLLVALQR